MERIICRCLSLLVALGLTIAGPLSNGIGQQITLEQLEKAAAKSIETGNPILVYMFDTT